ncbi:MAG: hypothetical protein A2284_07880 [Deltaproteobacteria bacterium RIFOXYA12_FULL_61_11]|nr:MAG: hypothetical protein A2284_07880 [Deltaproteobacteria bacterium RIFOXYA12_FULL_61_11]
MVLQLFLEYQEEMVFIRTLGLLQQIQQLQKVIWLQILIPLRFLMEMHASYLSLSLLEVFLDQL